MTSPFFSFLSIGGIGETGFNTYIFNVNGVKFLVDLGIAMPSPLLPSTSTILPDIRSMREIFKDIEAIIFTHGHDDHIGAFPYFSDFFNIPVVASPLTIELINSKLEEMGKKPLKNTVIIRSARQKFNLMGCEIGFFKTRHSIPDSYGIYFTTDFGDVVFTSDFKEIYGLSGLPAKPFILFFDATNSEINENKDEAEVNRNIERLFEKNEGAIIVSTFSTNLERIKKVIALSKKYKKKIFAVGKNLENTIKIGKNLKIFDNFPVEDFDRINRYERDKIVLLTTGTQGERYSALNFISMGSFRGFKIKEKDTIIISSGIIPRNEIYIYDMINRLSEKGATVYYAKTDNIHSSGHASIKELSQIFTHFKPQYIVPMHGEYRQISMARKFIHSRELTDSSILMPPLGEEYIFKSEDRFVTRKHEIKKLYIDDDSQRFISLETIRERKRLAENGVAIIKMGSSISFDQYGLIDLADPIWEELKKHILKIKSNNQDLSEGFLERDIRSFFKRKTGKKPLVIVNLGVNDVS